MRWPEKEDSPRLTSLASEYFMLSGLIFSKAFNLLRHELGPSRERGRKKGKLWNVSAGLENCLVWSHFFPPPLRCSLCAVLFFSYHAWACGLSLMWNFPCVFILSLLVSPLLPPLSLSWSFCPHSSVFWQLSDTWGEGVAGADWIMAFGFMRAWNQMLTIRKYVFKQTVEPLKRLFDFVSFQQV